METFPPQFQKLLTFTFQLEKKTWKRYPPQFQKLPTFTFQLAGIVFSAGGSFVLSILLRLQPCIVLLMKYAHEQLPLLRRKVHGFVHVLTFVWRTLCCAIFFPFCLNGTSCKKQTCSWYLEYNLLHTHTPRG